MDELSKKVMFLYRAYKGTSGELGAYDMAKKNKDDEHDNVLLQTVQKYLEVVVEYNKNRIPIKINANGEEMTDHEFGIRHTKATVIELLKDRKDFDAYKMMFPIVLELENHEKYL